MVAGFTPFNRWITTEVGEASRQLFSFISDWLPQSVTAGGSLGSAQVYGGL